ncbi:DUF4012 domain-containing protein [Microbacterium sp.]|uniref:DUF4012 domain-containing protein n=1 Tax=Microbacterium sp. TaxID=51671 RepID=UPI0025D68065|nr:DUF4012 domain-containing protein [Microbacterium sp.]
MIHRATEVESRRARRDLARETEKVSAKRRWLWIASGLGLLLIVGAGLAGWRIIADGNQARASLEQAIPLASQIEAAVATGDVASAQQLAGEFSKLTADAHGATDTLVWRLAEPVPFVGGNLVAVRVAAAVADEIATGLITPIASVDIGQLKSPSGGIDVDRLEELSTMADGIVNTLAGAQDALAAVPRDSLIPQVQQSLATFDGLLAQLQGPIAGVHSALAVLPAALGAETPQNYLILVQNNAESRGTGGNPAALVLITVDRGNVSITQQASALDFVYGRPEPIIPLDPATAELYGTKVARYVQDVTTTPDFAESAQIITAMWDELYDTPINGVVSIDPVAMSYLLNATGPVGLPSGQELTADNAVDVLLNTVYFEINDLQKQDDFFAVAAVAFIAKLTAADDVRAIVEQSSRALAEGRILYAPTDETQAQLLAGARVLGAYPASNETSTLFGAYVNDITEGKLDYYMRTAIAVETDVCQTDGAPTFTQTMSLSSTVDPAAARSLPWYVSTANYFPKGVISTDVVMYGPVGAQITAVAVDGVPTAFTQITHLGRPAAKINVINQPSSTHAVAMTFTGGDGPFGPIEIWTTPMVRETPVAVMAPGCQE